MRIVRYLRVYMHVCEDGSGRKIPGSFIPKIKSGSLLLASTVTNGAERVVDGADLFHEGGGGGGGGERTNRSRKNLAKFFLNEVSDFTRTHSLRISGIRNFWSDLGLETTPPK